MQMVGDTNQRTGYMVGINIEPNIVGWLGGWFNDIVQ